MNATEKVKDPLADLGVVLYYLNLDRDIVRREDMERQAKEHGIVLHRIPGVLGSDLKSEDLTSYDAKRRMRIMTTQIGAGEQGCILSHLKAMKTFLASEAEYAVIFEDDADILPGFAENLRYIIKHTSGWGYVKLYSEPTKMLESPKNPEGARVKLAFHKKLPWGAVGYMLTRNAAQKLLKLFEKGYWLTYDVQLSYFLMRYDIPSPGVMGNIVSTHFPFSEESAIDNVEARRDETRSVMNPKLQKKRGPIGKFLRYLNYRWHTWTMSYLKQRGRRTLAKALKFR